MREFKDDEGRPWRLALTTSAVNRVRDNVTVEIDGVATPFKMDNVAEFHTTIHILRTQLTVLAEVLYHVLCNQVAEKKLAKDEFLDGIRGEVWDVAGKAIEEELLDFFRPRHRPLASLTAEAHQKNMDAVWEQATEQMKKAMEQVIQMPSGMPSGKPLESLESTQESGLSDNSLPLATPA
jgi:hypothetical protein